MSEGTKGGLDGDGDSLMKEDQTSKGMLTPPMSNQNNFQNPIASHFFPKKCSDGRWSTVSKKVLGSPLEHFFSNILGSLRSLSDW